jgi:hypothetical protein
LDRCGGELSVKEPDSSFFGKLFWSPHHEEEERGGGEEDGFASSMNKRI